MNLGQEVSTVNTVGSFDQLFRTGLARSHLCYEFYHGIGEQSNQ